MLGAVLNVPAAQHWFKHTDVPISITFKFDALLICILQVHKSNSSRSRGGAGRRKPLPHLQQGLVLWSHRGPLVPSCTRLPWGTHGLPARARGTQAGVSEGRAGGWHPTAPGYAGRTGTGPGSARCRCASCCLHCSWAVLSFEVLLAALFWLLLCVLEAQAVMGTNVSCLWTKGTAYNGSKLVSGSVNCTLQKRAWVVAQDWSSTLLLKRSGPSLAWLSPGVPTAAGGRAVSSAARQQTCRSVSE